MGGLDAFWHTLPQHGGGEGRQPNITTGPVGCAPARGHRSNHHCRVALHQFTTQAVGHGPSYCYIDHPSNEHLSLRLC